MAAPTAVASQDDGEAQRAEDVGKAALGLIDVERSQTIFKLETSSVYGSGFAFPQIARSSGYQSVFVTLWIRSYLALALNYVVQFALVMFVGEATQIMNPLGGQMHLCDFGADLDICKGPEAPFQPRCTGPGGTQFSPSRLYGYTQWAVQKFTKQALVDVLPDQEDLINEKVDPGEYGLENRTCRWVCLLLFALAVNHEIQVCFRMMAMLWFLPHAPDKCDWIEIDKKNKNKASYRIAGMPTHWKLITALTVLIPKVTLCYFVLLEGTTLLMDTSGILDTVLGAMSMAFILDVDEMLQDLPRCFCRTSCFLQSALSETGVLRWDALANERVESCSVAVEHCSDGELFPSRFPMLKAPGLLQPSE